MIALLLVLVSLPLGYWTLIWFAQRALLYPSPPASAGMRPPHDAELIWLGAPGGPTEAWMLPAMSPDNDPSATGPAILFAHGNGELIDYLPDWFRPAREAGFAVLLVEYPGYGRSAGKTTEDSIRRTLVAGFDYLAASPEIDSGRIVAFGRSLGGGAIGTLIGQRAVAAVILQSTFRSIVHMARRFLVPAFVVRDRFDTIGRLQQYNGPLLLVHGDRDDIVPLAESEALHFAYPASELVVLPCGHNDCPPSWPEHWRVILAFLSQHGISPASDPAP